MPMSDVEVSMSTSIMLNETSTTDFHAERSHAASTGASVVMKPYIVAMSGWIIPDPLAQPPTW